MLVLKAGLLSALLALSAATVTHEVMQDWPGGLKLSFTLTADQDINDWTLSVHSAGQIDQIDCDWVGQAKAVSSNEWQVTNLGHNGHLAAGTSLTDVMVIRCSPDCGDVQVSDGHGGTGGGSTGGGTPGGGNTGGAGTTASSSGGGNTGGNGGCSGGVGTKNYGDALAKSILFYDAQRSGRLPGNNPIHWRGDSATSDCVVGGWYDAGDHVKFGLPFGSTTHLLLWGLYKFKDGYEAAGQLDMGYDMIKWATDYMLGAWNPGSHELVAQIGEGGADHSFWGRPEDMNMGRPCYKVGPGKPAADLMGEWAGALAAGYLVFKDKGDTAYADKLLSAAESMYDFAKSNPGTYTNSVPNVASFYGSTGYKDEMCLGGVWLYKATLNSQYLNDAKGYHESGTAWALSWDDKKVACQLLLYEETQDNSYKSDVEGFIHDYMPGGSVAYTPCGLAWRDKWGANRYAGNAAFIALAAAEAGINPGASNKWGVEQINYLLGDNRHDGGCFSYEIGYGSKYPRSPHHRASSCPDRPAPCSDAQRTAGGPSPHLLNGALVGGPDQGGNYRDSREDYVMNEVAIDYNSGFHSALAAINHLKATNSVPPTNNKCPCHG